MNQEACTRLKALLKDQFHVAFGKDMDALLAGRGAELWIVGLDSKNKKLTDVCGTIGAQHMATLNARGYFDTDAGFKTNAENLFPSFGKTVDIFLLNHDHFEKADDFLVPLVVHELAHHLEDIKENPEPTKADQGNAAAIYIGLEDNVQRIHTRTWAQFLAIGARACVEAGNTGHKTLKEFLEAAVPSYDRRGPFSIRE